MKYFFALFFINILVPSLSYAFSLQDCVALALKNNPEIHQQQLHANIANQDLVEQKSSSFGSLEIISSFTHYNLPRTLAPLTPASIFHDPAGVPTTDNMFVAGIAYELPLFTGFAQTRNIEISGLQKKLMVSKLKLSQEQLIYNVKIIYVNILSVQAGYNAQKNYVQSLEQLHEDIAREFKLGKKARIELIKAEADLQNGRAALIRIGSDINILKASLANLLNIETIPALEEIIISAETIHPREYITDPEAYPLERLKAAELEVEKNKKQILKVKSILYPQLVFNTSYLQNFGPNDDSNKNSGDWENQEVWQAGINLKWNVFDFGLSRAKIQKAKIMEQQSRYEQTKIELELKRSLLEAVTKINTGVSDYNSAREEYTLTLQTESIEQIRYEQGAADINDLLYAKARNQLAYSRFIHAGYAYISAVFYLDYLLEQGEISINTTGISSMQESSRQPGSEQ